MKDKQLSKKINQDSWSRGLFVLIQIFFYLIRKICKATAYKDGNIIVISLHKLGDTVFTIPAIKELEKFYKQKIVILCYPESIPIYRQVLSNAEYYSLNNDGFYFNGRIAKRNTRKILRSYKPKIIFDLKGVMTSATMIFNSRAKQIVGTNRILFKNIYDNYIPVRKAPQLIDIYLDIISVLVPDLDREEIRKFPVNINPDGKILLQPFAGWPAKEWGMNKFLKIADELNKTYNISIVVPIKTIPEDILTTIKNLNIHLIETQSVDDLIRNIKSCSVFIGNDSGPLYMASMLGKPTFAIYGSTNPDFHLPIGKNHSYSKILIRCSPKANEKICFTDGGLHGCPSFECMKQLSYEKVVNEIKNFIDELRIKKKHNVL